MSFSNAYQRRNFNGPLRRNPFRRPVVIRRNVNNNVNRSKKRVRQNPNRAMQSERIEKFKVYAGSLTEKGLIISCGPNQAQFGNTNFCHTALNFNNYRPVSLSLEYTPLLNQTNAVSMINAYLTTDVKATIPTTDVDMKNSTVCHNGVEWFAANRVTKRFKVPVLKQNTYETGSGDVSGGSPYEEAAFIFVKPTSAGDKDLTFGELYLNISVAFTSAATPIIGQKAVIEVGGGGIKPDLAYKFSDVDSNIISIIVLSHYYKYYCNNYSVDSKAVNVWYNFANEDADEDAIQNLKTQNGNFFMFKNNVVANDIYYDWNGDEWVEKAATSVQLVDLISSLTLTDYTLVNRLFGDKTLVAKSIPTHNKITDDTDNTKVEIQDQPILVNIQEQPVLVNIADLPVEVEVVNNPLPVEVVKQPIEVEVKNEVDVIIQEQPIQVHVEKDTGEKIFDFLKGVASVIPIRSADSDSDSDVETFLPA